MWLFTATLASAAERDTLVALVEAGRAHAEGERLQAAVDRAEASVAASWQGALPTVRVEAGYTRNQFEAVFPQPQGDEVVISPRDQLDVTGRLSVPVFAPAAWSRIHQMDLERDTAGYRDLEGRAALDRSVVAAWARVRTSEAEARSARSAVDASRALVSTVEARDRVGQASPLDLLDARASLANAESALAAADASGTSAREALARLTGREPGPGDLDPDAITSPVAAVGTPPSLVAARDAERAAAAAVRGARWQYAPTVSAFATERWSNATGFAGQALTWQLGATATVSLFEGRSRAAAVGAAAASLREQSALRVLAEADRTGNVATATAQSAAAVAALDAAEAVLLARAEQRRTVTVSFEAGASSSSDVASAVADELQAASDRHRAAGDVALARADLRLALGVPVLEEVP